MSCTSWCWGDSRKLFLALNLTLCFWVFWASLWGPLQGFPWRLPGKCWSHVCQGRGKPPETPPAAAHSFILEFKENGNLVRQPATHNQFLVCWAREMCCRKKCRPHTPGCVSACRGAISTCYFQPPQQDALNPKPYKP